MIAYRGNLCGPMEEAGEPWTPTIPLSDLERTLIDRELQLGLSACNFDTFERCIKRFGYTGRVTDTTLEEVRSEIHVKTEDLTNRNEITHFYFQDDRVFDHGNYNPDKLLVLGFLLCKHKSTRTA